MTANHVHLHTPNPKPYPGDPNIQIMPILGRKVRKYYLHWALWIFRPRAGSLTTVLGTPAGLLAEAENLMGNAGR